MSYRNTDSVTFLQLTLHNQLIGYLAGHRNGKNILTIVETFRENTKRPTLSLTTLSAFPGSNRVMTQPWVNNHHLHPILSNLLPEGSLREYLAQQLKIHVQDEFKMLAYLGADLPGALIAMPIDPQDMPAHILSQYDPSSMTTLSAQDQQNKFSLAGVQMKFSMKEKDMRFTIPDQGILGDWIIKTPSTKHKDVPTNEFSAMKLAELAGIYIPEIQLVKLDQLDHLPAIYLPEEEYAYAIKRFDRHFEERIHIEDFAQVLAVQPQQKYHAANYENIAKILYQFSQHALHDTHQFADRLLINILLANGDAHLKNWSLIYPDQQHPQLAPAYDILTTSLYFQNETQFALNLAKNKYWYQANFSHFEYLAKKADIPWQGLKHSLNEALEKARTLWPQALINLPMTENHKKHLTTHWKNLHPDFQILLG